MQREALLILVGITASRRDLAYLLDYFKRNSDYEVFVPELPYRKGIRLCAQWLQEYIHTTLEPHRYTSMHAIVYIAGGILLRCFPAEHGFQFGRMVYFRGPIQERVAGLFVHHFSRWLTRLLRGQSVIDLADGWPSRLPKPTFSEHQGLIIEMGQSRLARMLGISHADIPPGDWEPQELLPAAEDVLPVAESHDDVYTTDAVLALALRFIRQGRFNETAAENEV